MFLLLLVALTAAVPHSHVSLVLGQMEIEEFYSTYWQKTFVRFPSRSSYLRSLVSENVFQMLDGCISPEQDVPYLVPSDARLLKRVRGPDGEWWSGSPQNISRVNSSVARHYFSRGFSLILNKLNYHSGPVAELCQDWGHVFGFVTDGNLYFTPPGAQAFESHFDWMETFVLQLAGSKVWRLYASQLDFPRPDLKFKPTLASLGEPIASFVMTPGDVLYMPSGVIHEAYVPSFAEAESSLHLTLGVVVDPMFTWTGFVLTLLADTVKTLSAVQQAVLHQQLSPSLQTPLANCITNPNSEFSVFDLVRLGVFQVFLPLHTVVRQIHVGVVDSSKCRPAPRASTYHGF
jgi:hypothetical protein